jgi:predicted dehydrogenase
VKVFAEKLIPVKKLTASVVGCGKGGRLSLQALAESEFYAPLAAADLRPEVGDELRKKFPSLRIFADFREMFATCPTDVVCVSTYPPSHEEIAAEALKGPLEAILVEKPIADTVASGRRILDFVRQSWIPLAVPHGLMVKRCPLEIIERVRSGEIGELKLVEIQSPNFDIMSAGIHWLQFSISLNANHSVGSVLAACDKTTRTFRDGMKVETVAVTSVQMVNGVRIVMHTGDTVRSNGSRQSDVTFRILGTVGQIEFWGWLPDYYLVSPAFPYGKLFEPEEQPVSLHRRHLDNLIPMLRSKVPDYSLPESSLKALEICEAAYFSAKHGVEVRFPFDEFALPEPSDWQPGTPYFGEANVRDVRYL